MSEVRNGCAKVRGLLEAYLEGVLPAEQERIVAGHLWQCTRCAAELVQIQRMTAALDALPQMEPARELLVAISGRIATLPTPMERRVSAGWRRLGVAVLVAMATAAVVFYGGALLLPALLAQAKPVLVWFAGGWQSLTMWAADSYRAGLVTTRALLAFLPALRALTIAAAPVLIGYAAAELVCLAVAAWVIHARYRRVLVPSRAGTRRS